MEKICCWVTCVTKLPEGAGTASGPGKLTRLLLVQMVPSNS